MNISNQAMIIMYSTTKVFLEERIEMCERTKCDCPDYKHDLEIVEKAWSDYLEDFCK